MIYLTRTAIVLTVLSLATLSPALGRAGSVSGIPTVTISGSVGVPGVVMQGLPGNPITDRTGFYIVNVEQGWSGTIIPIKEGYLFKPTSVPYSKVLSNIENQNYIAKVITYTISGNVIMAPGTFQGSPLLPGVVMQGLPNNPVTDEGGYYTCTVDYGWAGIVKPVKKGYAFNPPELSYTKVMRVQNKQNYTAEPSAQVQGPYGEGGWEPPRAWAGARGSRRVARTTGFQPADSRRVLVVPAAEVNPKDLAEITEDMQIMSHILDERFKETRRVQGVFTDFGDFFGRDNRQTEATYLQGYGVLFSMEVNFAFSSGPKQQEQQAEQADENVDSTWLKARQQVFSPGETRGPGGSDSAEEYNSQMVEELKRDLITTLKHAANIRGIQPDEWVILTVIGGGRQSGTGFGGGGFMMGGMGGMYGGTSSGGMMGGMGGGMGGFGGGSGGGGMGGGMMGGMSGSGMMGGGMGAVGGMGGFSDMSVSVATVLTIRAKKSDVDAFAKGEQDFEQFRPKVQIFTY